MLIIRCDMNWRDTNNYVVQNLFPLRDAEYHLDTSSLNKYIVNTRKQWNFNVKVSLYLLLYHTWKLISLFYSHGMISGIKIILEKVQIILKKISVLFPYNFQSFTGDFWASSGTVLCHFLELVICILKFMQVSSTA